MYTSSRKVSSVRQIAPEVITKGELGANVRTGGRESFEGGFAEVSNVIVAYEDGSNELLTATDFASRFKNDDGSDIKLNEHVSPTSMDLIDPTLPFNAILPVKAPEAPAPTEAPKE